MLLPDLYTKIGDELVQTLSLTAGPSSRWACLIEALRKEMHWSAVHTFHLQVWSVADCVSWQVVAVEGKSLLSFCLMGCLQVIGTDAAGNVESISKKNRRSWKQRYARDTA